MAKKVLARRKFEYTTKKTFYPPVTRMPPETVTRSPTAEEDVTTRKEVEEEEEVSTMFEEDNSEDDDFELEGGVKSEGSSPWKVAIMIIVSLIGITCVVGLYIATYQACGRCFRLNNQFQARLRSNNPRQAAECYGVRFRKRSNNGEDMSTGQERQPLIEFHALATIMEEVETQQQQQQQEGQVQETELEPISLEDETDVTSEAKTKTEATPKPAPSLPPNPSPSPPPLPSPPPSPSAPPSTSAPTVPPQTPNS